MTLHIQGKGLQVMRDAIMEYLRMMKADELGDEDVCQEPEWEQDRLAAIEIADSLGCNVDWETLDPEAD